MDDITNISTSCFEERVDGIFSLLRKDDPRCPSGPPGEESLSELFIGRGVISEAELDRVQSEVSKNILLKYNIFFGIVGITRGIRPHIILRFLKNGTYYLQLDAYDGYYKTIRKEVITEDVCVEYIEAFHERFSNSRGTRIPKFTGSYYTNIKGSEE